MSSESGHLNVSPCVHVTAYGAYHLHCAASGAALGLSYAVGPASTAWVTCGIFAFGIFVPWILLPHGGTMCNVCPTMRGCTLIALQRLVMTTLRVGHTDRTQIPVRSVSWGNLHSRDTSVLWLLHHSVTAI